jgi:hypothetical protein
MGSSNRKIEAQVEYTHDGKLIWLHPRKKSLVGTECGYKTKNGYLRMACENKHVMVHHVVWYLHNGVWPDPSMDIDHINMDKLDNRIENLRQVSRTINALNNRALGVSKNKQGWRARVGQKYLGTFKDETHAIMVAKEYKHSLISKGIS